jgi:hypothetical protein
MLLVRPVQFHAICQVGAPTAMVEVDCFGLVASGGRTGRPAGEANGGVPRWLGRDLDSTNPSLPGCCRRAADLPGPPNRTFWRCRIGICMWGCIGHADHSFTLILTFAGKCGCRIVGIS